MYVVLDNTTVFLGQLAHVGYRAAFIIILSKVFMTWIIKLALKVDQHACIPCAFSVMNSKS